MLFDCRDLTRFAILLDVDGTLLDIAPTPREVQVPPSLPGTLARLNKRLEGALAIVSGRPISQTDAFFSPLKLPAIGGHGAEMRATANGSVVKAHMTEVDPDFKKRLEEIAANHPGVLVEDKGYSVALHYRLVPKQGVGLVHDIKHAFAAWNHPEFELLSGKAVLEIKFAGFNKGTAVRDLMAHPPFKGRAPIFVGDDHTDEDAFAVVPDFNGHAISVGRRLPGIDECFKSPTEVREWLSRLCADVPATA